MAQVHIVGAGLAGLSCAVSLAARGHPVVLYEAAARAGGRCRSYFDEKLGRTIDNGNHLLLSANHAALGYLETIGARDTLIGPARAAFAFADLRDGTRWTVRPNGGPVPWWVLSSRRRIPGTRAWSYLAGLRLARAGATATVADCLDPADPLWERFWEPLTVAALNTSPEEASARLLWSVVRETFARGEAACRPLVARDGLSASLIDPALAFLRARGGTIHFNKRLRAIEVADGRVTVLAFGGTRVVLAPGAGAVIALPPAVAGEVVPGLAPPRESRPIVNAHVALPAAPALPEGLSPAFPVLGLIGGTAHWLFLRGAVASLTVSAAGALADEPNERIAARLWADTAAALGLPGQPRPPVRVIKERRATFAQTPVAVGHRAPARTQWRNLALAGDWTDTGYPATIEGAIRSGQAAAAVVAPGTHARDTRPGDTLS